MAKNYETLDAWKEAVELAVAIYEITSTLNEVESLLIISSKLKFLNDKQFESIKERVEMEGRLLGGLLKHVANRLKEN